MTLTEANSKRDTLNSILEQELDKQTDAWGIDVIRVELQRIEPPSDVQQAMNNVVIAEREKKAALLLEELSAKIPLAFWPLWDEHAKQARFGPKLTLLLIQMGAPLEGDGLLEPLEIIRQRRAREPHTSPSIRVLDAIAHEIRERKAGRGTSLNPQTGYFHLKREATWLLENGYD